MLRAGLAAAAGLALVLGTLVAVLSQRGERLAGTNSYVEVSGVALPVAPGGERCAGRQRVPADTAGVRVYAGTFGRPRGEPLLVSVRQAGRQVSSGRVPGGYPDNARVRVPLARIERNLYSATVCLRNLGSQRMQFAGNLSTRGGVRLRGKDVIRYDWLLPGRPSWLGIAPEVASRFAATKPTFVGAWTFWAVFAVLAVLWSGAIALVVRQERR